MEEVKFKNLQRGDTVFSLERDRRSMYPIFDHAKVVKVGESKPRATEKGDGFANLIEVTIQDSIGTVTVLLPSDAAEGIYSNVYYTLNPENIKNEVSLQKEQALGVINNIPRYENIVKECENILGMFETRQVNLGVDNTQQLSQTFEAFKNDVTQVLQSQQQALGIIMDSLGLNKQPNNPDGK